MKITKQNKYHNKKAFVGNILFDSKKECDYFYRLKLMEQVGMIKDIKFTYITTEDNKLHVVDVKGYRTEVYKLKKKLFEYKYNMEIEEI